MRKIILKTFILLLCTFTGGRLQSQAPEPSVISAGGGFQKSGQVSISYTIGDLSVNSYSTANLSLTEGFQQPGSGIPDEIKDESVEVEFRTWPNPAVRELNMIFDPEWKDDILVEVYDVLGRIHIRKKYESPGNGETYRLDVSMLGNGLYILKARPSGPGKSVTIRFRKEQV